MKTKVKYLESDGVYIIRSFASANSLYFEDKSDHELFFQLFDRFMTPMLEILEYSLVSIGWVMLVKTRSETEISNFYHLFRSKSKKAIPGKEKTEIGQMISEHIRYMNSNYVKQSNQNKNRHGSKVHSSYEKLVLKDEVAYLAQIEAMRNLRMFCEQVEERYQANPEYYDDTGMKGKSKWKTGGGKFSRGMEVISAYLGDLDLDVVRNLIYKTWKRHFSNFPPQFPPPFT